MVHSTLPYIVTPVSDACLNVKKPPEGGFQGFGRVGHARYDPSDFRMDAFKLRPD